MAAPPRQKVEFLPPAVKAALKAKGAEVGPLLGLEVEVSGLGARADLNGARGVAFSLSGERYGVRMQHTGECVKLRPANLAPPAASTASRPDESVEVA